MSSPLQATRENLALQLRPLPPIPSPVHGRRPSPSSPPPSSRRILSLSSSLSPFPTSVEDDWRFIDAPPPDQDPLAESCTKGLASDWKEDDWFRFPAPTRAHARAGVPLVDTLGQAEKQQEVGGAGRLKKKEWKMLGEWRVGESLGKGTSGHVRLSRSVKTGEFAAIKKVLRLPAGYKHANSVHREISLMKLVAPHPHVVELLDVFETPTHLYLVMEYCPDGELFNLIVKRPLSHVEIHKFYTQLISALLHLSHSSICHRDVKFENLLLYTDERGELCLKLSDMGMATFQPEGCLLRTSCGSPHYAAPEVIKAIPYEGSLADVWSSGIVLYTMFARRLPFDDEHIPTLLDMIKNRDYEMHESIKGSARDLVRRCLVKEAGRRIKLHDIASHPFLTPLPFTPEPLSLEAIYPPTRAVAAEVDLLKDNELDDVVLQSLAIVLKVAGVEEAKRLVGNNDGRARLFYTILRAFREPRQPSTTFSRQYARSIDLDNESLPESVQPFMSSIRRSMSAPDMRASPIPTDGEGVKSIAMRPSVEDSLVTGDGVGHSAAPSSWSARSSVDSGHGPDGRSIIATQRYSLINREYAFPPTPTTTVPLVDPPPTSPTSLVLAPQVVTSAPPHVESFAIRPLAISPVEPVFFGPISLVGRNGTRGRSRPGTGATTATQSLPVSPLLKPDPAFAIAATEAVQPARRPSIDVGEIARRLSTLAAGASTTLHRGPSKKASMQQRLKSLFQSQGGKRASVVSVPEDAKVEGGKVNPRASLQLKRPVSFSSPPPRPPPACPLPPPPQPAPTAAGARPAPDMPTIRPPSPAPSAASSMLKRSSAYRSFGRALDGKPPLSPELADFGELLAMGASANLDARASHALLVSEGVQPQTQKHQVVRKKMSTMMGGLLKISSSPSRPSLEPPSSRASMAQQGAGIQFYHDEKTGKSKPTITPTPLPSPSKRKGRPTPLTINSTNLIRPSPLSAGTATPGTAKSLFKPPSILGLGRTPRRPLLSPQQPSSTLSPVPSVTIDSPSSPASGRDKDDPEDPFSLISALKQYPYRSASANGGSGNSARSRRSVSSSVGPFSTSAGSTFRNVSGSTNATTLSARSPRIGEDDYFEHDEGLGHSTGNGYSSSYAASLGRERDLNAQLRKVELENKLLHAAVEARDDELELLRRQERRLTQCVESGEEVVRELSKEREELEDLVRELDWGKRSFLSMSGTAEEERDIGENEDEEQRRLRLSRKVREDEWLQSLKERPSGPQRPFLVSP
ncbi:hypothetical protein JCM11251_003309 [Rhodosporidiobolus azoricus]